MYESLKNEVEKVLLIDNHGHPGLAEFFDPYPPEQRLTFAVDKFRHPRDSQGEFDYQVDLHYQAYEKLYGFSRADLDNPAKEAELEFLYQQKRLDTGRFIDEVMAISGIEKIIANFVLPDSLKNKSNVQFTPLIDPLVLPFDNSALQNRVLGKSLMSLYRLLLDQLKTKYGYEEAGYHNYLCFIDRALEGYLAEGCCGFKFGIAYARTTFFENVSPAKGPILYQRAMTGDAAAYIELQDLLMWYTMRKIVALDVPVQFHFAITDHHIRSFDPLNLANMIEDEGLKNAKIVVLHGGYPNFRHAETLALGGLSSSNNVHIDFSGRIMFANHPKIIARMLRDWLEKPALWGKLLYGSDIIWGERYLYTCARTGRDAVYLAIESLLDDKIIGMETALELARKLLRDNACALYQFTDGVS